MTRIGIALSGGGARGIAHLGVLQVLYEMKIPVACISGTSAGSIAGALFAAGVEPAKVIRHLKGPRVLLSLRPSWGRPGLFSLEPVSKLLQEFIPANDFSSLNIPLTVTATNLNSGEVRYFSEGNLSDAVGASCCVPGIFAPVQMDGQFYADGGIIENLPVKPLEGHCDLIIGVHCNPVSTTFNELKIRQVVERSLLLAIGRNTIESRKHCDVFLEPEGLEKYSAADFGKSQEIYEVGYRYALKHLSSELIKVEAL
jgi:NTE family protein